MENDQIVSTQNSTSRSTRERKGRISREKNEGKHRRKKVDGKSCVPFFLCVPAGTSIEVQNEWEENTHNPSKCHEEVLYLQPVIPPNKRFDIFFPPDWGMLRRSGCVLIFFK